MKNTYYYNNQKLRTSNNIYTHALISMKDGQICLWACCGRYDLALKRYNQELNDAIKGKAYNEELLNEVANGTYKTWGHDSKGNYCRCKEVTAEELAKAKAYIEESLARCERIIKTLQIVELERKEGKKNESFINHGTL